VARQLCEREKPNIVVLDAPVMRGDEIELLHDFRKLHPPVRTLILSDREDAFSVQRAFRAGVCAYLSKQDEVAVLLAALDSVLGGGLFVSPRVLHVLLEDLAHGGERGKEHALAALSDRELQIFRLLGRGFGATAIARELTVSVKTVETHQARMKEKLHLSNGAELRREALARARRWLAQRST
jgi:DNA-binding NarL/FixJ family response regulator